MSVTVNVKGVGRWHRFTLVDVHPMDAGAIEAGLVAYLDGSYRR